MFVSGGRGHGLFCLILYLLYIPIRNKQFVSRSMCILKKLIIAYFRLFVVLTVCTVVQAVTSVMFPLELVKNKMLSHGVLRVSCCRRFQKLFCALLLL